LVAREQGQRRKPSVTPEVGGQGAANVARHESATDRVDERLDSQGRPVCPSQLVEVRVTRGEMAAPVPDRADDAPRFPVQTHVSPNHPLWEGSADVFALPVRGEALLAQAVPQEATEQRLAAAMADGVGEL
jgi:hypothetical protein